jgi:hypothetical protein
MKNTVILLFCLLPASIYGQSAKQLSWSKPPLGQPTARQEFKATGVSQREIRDRVFRFAEQKKNENAENTKNLGFEDNKYYLIYGPDEDVKIKSDQVGIGAMSFIGSKQDNPFGYNIKVTCKDGGYELRIEFLAHDSKFVTDDQRNAVHQANYERFLRDLDAILGTIEGVVLQKNPTQEQKDAAPSTRKKLG